jgi:hypothetical protein
MRSSVSFTKEGDGRKVKILFGVPKAKATKLALHTREGKQ